MQPFVWQSRLLGVLISKWTKSFFVFKGLTKFAFLAGFASVVFVLLCNTWVVSSTDEQVYKTVDEIPYRKVGLVLGTSKTINGKWDNLFFTYRVNAASTLFHKKKISHILVSGDNSNMNYNEPRDMKQALKKLGVPDSCITMDFGGRKTLDSVVRCKKVFLQNEVTIISQGIHDHRALFIANYYGMDAVAYDAKYPNTATKKTAIREILARVKAVTDLYIFNRQPRFLGDAVIIQI